jgi:hypothetical protein
VTQNVNTITFISSNNLSEKKFSVLRTGWLKTCKNFTLYEGVTKSFRTGRLDRELQMVSSLPLGAVVSLFYESF